ncbi:hypothetical protein ABVT39_001510 [Epinephelus coioides]
MNDQEDNAERNEEEESTDEEDSGSEEEENNDEVIYPTYRPHANSSSGEAPTLPTAEMEEVEENDEQDDEVGSEAEMEEVSEVEDCTDYDEEEESIDEEESEEEDTAETAENFQSKDETLIWSSILPSDGRHMLTARRATSHHGTDVTVDERLVPFRGRCPFKQFIPTKPGKYGIKIWVTCDTRSSYAWNMQIYTGKPAAAPSEKKQGMRVVLDVTEGLQGKTITCDNFFTSHALGLELLKRKMYMVGIVRKNKPEFPPALVARKNRAQFLSKFVFTETHALVSYHPKKQKNFLLMSTLHRDTAVSNREDKRPRIIEDYNHNKGGVDNLCVAYCILIIHNIYDIISEKDNTLNFCVTSVYMCKRKTARWPLAVFFNILNVSVYNAFVLWSEIHTAWNQGKKNRRRLFMEELGRQLVIPHINRRMSDLTGSSLHASHCQIGHGDPAVLLQLCSSSPLLSSPSPSCPSPSSPSPRCPSPICPSPRYPSPSSPSASSPSPRCPSPSSWPITQKG